MKDNGNSIWDKDKENNNFKMEQDFKVITNKTRNKVKESFSGLMEIHIRDNLGIIKDKEKV